MDASFIISISSVFGIVGTMFSGVISDRFFGGRRNIPALIFGLMNVFALCLFLLVPGVHFWMDALAMILFGLGIGVLICFLGGLMAVDIAPDTYENAMTLRLEPNCTSGNDVLSVSNLAKSFDNKSLFSDISFEIKRGERVALIGDNGTGKTTILKIINGLIAADSGSFTLGTNVNIGYYDQEHHTLNDSNTLFDEVSDSYPNLTNTKIRNVLAAFMFTGDDVFKRVGDLSGGEKGRLSLAKLMLSPG